MATKKNKNKTKNPPHRPYKPIDWDTVDKLLRIACTASEIADFLGVNQDTLTDACKREKKMPLSDYIRMGNSEFKVSLRRAQFRSAMGVTRKEIRNGQEVEIQQVQPNVHMQIWLGKQFLGQTDKNENFNHEMPFVIERAGNDENPSL